MFWSHEYSVASARALIVKEPLKVVLPLIIYQLSNKQNI